MKLSFQFLVAAALCLFLGKPAVFGAEKSVKPVYDSKCASCHAKDGKGNPVMTKALKVELSALNMIDDETLAKTDEDLIKATAIGINKMPAYKGKLTDDVIKSLVAYIRSLKAVK